MSFMLPSVRKGNIDDDGPQVPLHQDQAGLSAGINNFKWHEPTFGKELDKDAQVWDIYVEETDRSDKELVKEWNDSLDVLLSSPVFSYHYGTYSLVIESSHQLQPDPAEASAQTLLTISRTLAAISNGQNVDDSSLSLSPSSEFSPSGVNVAINALWFLSLGLSVAVSLMAMLSKGWCNAFMSKRTGPKYEEGRRRQLKWRGIERWGMQSVFVYLPALMHLALLLFAVGLSLHLWNLDLRVASPVIALAAASVLVYIIATILPLVCDDCPFSTPLSKPLEQVRTTLALFLKTTGLRTLPKRTFKSLQKLVLAWRAYIAQWAYSIWKHASTTSVDTDDSPTRVMPDETPMDNITAHMLLWLVQNCEDQRLVNITLQSLAGACRGLPRILLIENNVLELLVNRLDGCFVDDPNSYSPHFNAASTINSVILYTRALSWLIGSDASCGFPFDDWSLGSNEMFSVFLRFRPNRALLDFYWKFLSRIFHLDDPMVDIDLAAIVISITAPLVHFYNDKTKGPSGIQRAIAEYQSRKADLNPSQAYTLHGRHLKTVTIRRIQDLVGSFSISSIPILLLAIESIPHWLIDSIDQDDGHNHKDVAMLLVQLASGPASASVELQHAVGLALVVFVMLINPYPGWKSPRSANACVARAIEVYNYHKAQRYKHSHSLVAFGLFGLLRAETYSFNKDETFAMIAGLKILGDITLLQSHIHTLPTTFGLKQEAASAAVKYIKEIQGPSQYSEAEVVQILLPLITASSGGLRVEHMRPVTELLCATKHTGLRQACAKVLDLSSRKMSHSDLGLIFGEAVDFALFNRLVHLSLGEAGIFIAPNVMCYLWRLIEVPVNVITRPNNEEDPNLCRDAGIGTEGFDASKITELASGDERRAILINMWLPLAREMYSWEPTKPAVKDSDFVRLVGRWASYLA